MSTKLLYERKYKRRAKKIQAKTKRLSIRSVSEVTHARLMILRGYTRLTFGALLDDCVDALWNEYLQDGHDLPELD